MNLPPEKGDADEINAWLFGRANEGLFIDKVVGSVLLRWPRDVAKFPYGAAWIELHRGEIVVGQGPMIVRLNLEKSHYVGSARLADLGVMPHEIAGLSSEAWAVWDEDFAALPPQAVDQLSRLLKSREDGNRNDS